MTRYIFKYGIEVECFLSTQRRPASRIEVGFYHRGNPLNENGNWEVQNDASLIPNNYDEWKSAEIVSRVFERQELFTVLGDLRQGVEGNQNEDSFRNFSINGTCGAHIHFSVFDKKLRKNRNFFKKLPISYLVRIRDNAHKKIKRELNHVYPHFRANYGRRHSLRINDDNYGLIRNCEFNFTTDKALEWRSFHLNGVTKWSELFRMYELAFDSIEETILPELYEEQPFKSAEFHIPQPEGVYKWKSKELQEFYIRKKNIELKEDAVFHVRGI